MKNRRQKRTVHLLHHHCPRAIVYRVHSPERDLAGHPAIIAITLAVLLAVGLLLSNIQIGGLSFGSWTVFG